MTKQARIEAKKAQAMTDQAEGLKAINARLDALEKSSEAMTKMLKKLVSGAGKPRKSGEDDEETQKVEPSKTVDADSK